MSDYKFTIDMLGCFPAVSGMVFDKFKDLPCRYLEIGVYEGRSGVWILSNILTHPEATYDGIDPYEPAHRHALATALSNFSSHFNSRILVGFSKNILPQFTPNQFEMIYVDGCHSYKGCKQDLELSWPLLKSGGVILCDDYNRDDYGVRQAVDEFLAGLPQDSYKLLYRDYKIAWEKV